MQFTFKQLLILIFIFLLSMMIQSVNNFLFLFRNSKEMKIFYDNKIEKLELEIENQNKIIVHNLLPFYEEMRKILKGKKTI